MNIPLVRTLGLATPPSPAPRTEEATVIAMGPSLSAVFFDRPPGRRQRLQADQDGAPIPRPFIAAELALRSGGTRHVLFMAQGTQTLLGRHLLLRLDGIPVAEVDPDWLQPPQAELPALVAQMSDRGLHRLFRVLLTTGASLFTPEAQAGLADAMMRLMDVCGVPTVQPLAKTSLAGRVLVSYPGAACPPADASALVNGQLVRLKSADFFCEGGMLHVLLPPRLRQAEILAVADAPLRLAAAMPSLRSLPVSAWLQGRSAACRDWLLRQAGCAASDMPSRGPSGELSQAAVKIRHLSAAPAGLLHALVLNDPMRLVSKVILECRGQQVELTPLRAVDGSTMLIGLAGRPDGFQNHDRCRIHAVGRSGDVRLLADTVVAPYDGTVPEGFEDAWNLGLDALEPLARARLGLCRKAPPVAVQQFGPVQKCALRIITAIGTSADVIRARAATILAERHGAPVEVVCTMAEGPLAVGARHALDQAATIYAIPHRLLLLPEHATAGEHLFAALSCSQNLPSLVLGADVLPHGRGWLAFWLGRLRRHGALAPALLASDGSIEATRAGDDPFRGLQAADLPPPGRRARRPLADCLALAPAGIARLLESGMPHPNPAVWIASSLQDSARFETRFPFRRFGPSSLPAGFAAALVSTELALLERGPE